MSFSCRPHSWDHKNIHWRGLECCFGNAALPSVEAFGVQCTLCLPSASGGSVPTGSTKGKQVRPFSFRAGWEAAAPFTPKGQGQAAAGRQTPTPPSKEKRGLWALLLNEQTHKRLGAVSQSIYLRGPSPFRGRQPEVPIYKHNLHVPSCGRAQGLVLRSDGWIRALQVDAALS